HGMVVSLHNANSPLATAMGCHLAAATPNFLVLETFDDFDDPWIRDALASGLRVEDGTVAVPQAPGIGIEPDESLLAEHPERPIFLNLNEPGWELRQGEIG